MPVAFCSWGLWKILNKSNSKHEETIKKKEKKAKVESFSQLRPDASKTQHANNDVKRKKKKHTKNVGLYYTPLQTQTAEYPTAQQAFPIYFFEVHHLGCTSCRRQTCHHSLSSRRTVFKVDTEFKVASRCHFNICSNCSEISAGWHGQTSCSI